MRLTSPLNLKAVVVYGLLTVTHALPYLPGADDPKSGSLEAVQARSIVGTDNGSLERRMPPSFFKGGKGNKDTPDAPPPRGPAGRPGDDGGAGPAGAVPKTPETKGAKLRAELETVIAKDKPDTSDWSKYDALMAKHNWNVRTEHPDPASPEIAVYKIAAPGQNPLGDVFSAKIDSDTSRVTVDAMYRKGGISDSLYGGVPEKDRPHPSDNIARAYSELGDGKPPSGISFDFIENPQMSQKLDEWSATKGNDFTITEKDPEWNWIMGSEVGSVVPQTLKDHPIIWKQSKPVDVRFSRSGAGGMWKADFDTVPASLAK